jgi:predicted SprT family Zn-dependent metalloprotease
LKDLYKLACVGSCLIQHFQVYFPGTEIEDIYLSTLQTSKSTNSFFSGMRYINSDPKSKRHYIEQVDFNGRLELPTSRYRLSKGVQLSHITRNTNGFQVHGIDRTRFKRKYKGTYLNKEYMKMVNSLDNTFSTRITYTLSDQQPTILFLYTCQSGTEQLTERKVNKGMSFKAFINGL